MPAKSLLEELSILKLWKEQLSPSRNACSSISVMCNAEALFIFDAGADSITSAIASIIVGVLLVSYLYQCLAVVRMFKLGVDGRRNHPVLRSMTTGAFLSASASSPVNYKKPIGCPSAHMLDSRPPGTPSIPPLQEHFHCQTQNY